jgi:replicative superfamily II helicase
MGRFVDIDTSQVLQMIGRAGRPQFDSSGVAVIMTDLGTEVPNVFA